MLKWLSQSHFTTAVLLISTLIYALKSLIHRLLNKPTSPDIMPFHDRSI